MILVICLCSGCHSAIFLAIQTRPSCRFHPGRRFPRPTPERVFVADRRSGSGYSGTDPEVGEIVGRDVKLEPNLVAAELAAGQPRPFEGVLSSNHKVIWAMLV